ncbi:MAG: MFS transporter [Rhodospirillaceae bacterium]
MDMAAAATRRQDTRVIGLVGVAHFYSHFYQLAFAPLFPFIVANDGLSYAQLGSVVMVFYITSGLAMTPMGVVVDRLGARLTLIIGLAMLATATALYGVTSSYWVMCGLAMVAGIGNSAFHPCDYSILSASVSEPRIGRAYSVHNFGGFLGYAVAPGMMFSIASVAGWRPAIIVAGLCAIPILVVLHLYGGVFRDSAHVRKEEGYKAPEQSALALMLQPSILLCFLFFALIAGATIGLQSFTPAALEAAFETPLAIGNMALTAFLIGTPVGILAGGAVVDRLRQPDLIAAVGYGFGAVVIGLVALTPLPDVLTVIAFAVIGATFGVAFPARDMLVRAITPRGSSGKVFGFVYAGLDLGAAVMPAILGWLMDAGEPRILFLLVAGCSMAGLFSLLVSRRVDARARRAVAAE